MVLLLLQVCAFFEVADLKVSPVPVDAFPSLLVPGGLAHPTKGEPGVCADLDGRCFGLPDSFLHRLHQILGIVDQHLRGLIREVELEQQHEHEVTPEIYYTLTCI